MKPQHRVARRNGPYPGFSQSLRQPRRDLEPMLRRPNPTDFTHPVTPSRVLALGIQQPGSNDA